ncbi:conjugal transfer protein TraG, partial [Butyricicoccus sp. 1XD8-22]
MNLENASFRRQPKVSTYHHILVDEAPEYLYPSFKSFPAQSRKYKVIITLLEQTLAQLSDEYGEGFKTILLASLRNKMFYGDLTGADAKEFSEISGEKLSYKEGENEQEVSALQDDPSNKSGASYQKQVEQLYTSNQLIYQEAFNCAVKIVEHNKPMPVRVIKAN